MPIYISLLRGINVGGSKKIKMDDLRALYESLGLENAKTLLQSGNVVFHSNQTNRAALAAQIEAGIEQQFGFHSAILLRATDELREVISRNPFTADQADPGKQIVVFLSEMPKPEAIDALLKAYTGPETIKLIGQEAFIYYPDGMGRSKLTNTLIERKLQTSGTARNWNTVTKLLDLAEHFER